LVSFFLHNTHKQPDFFPRIREHKKEYFGECKGAAEEAKPPFFLLARTLKFTYTYIYIYISLCFLWSALFLCATKGRRRRRERE